MIGRIRDYAVPLGVLALVGIGCVVLLIDPLHWGETSTNLANNLLASLIVIVVGILFIDDLIAASQRRRLRAYSDFIRGGVSNTTELWPHTIEPFIEAGARAGAHSHPPDRHAPEALRELIDKVGPHSFEACAACLVDAEARLRGARAEVVTMVGRWRDFASPRELDLIAAYELALMATVAFASVAAVQIGHPELPGHKDPPDVIAQRADELIREGARAALALYEELAKS